MANFKIFKETALPAELQANSLYLVAATAASFVEIYVTDAAGTAARRSVSIGDVNTIVNAAIAANTSGDTAGGMEVVDTFAAMNALVLEGNSFVFVIDATGDTTVAAGSASYVFVKATNTFVKVAEYESMDLALAWANISGKPNSTVEQIDTAVQQSHTHANATVLNALSVDGNGALTHDGALVGNTLSTVNW